MAIEVCVPAGRAIGGGDEAGRMAKPGSEVVEDAVGAVDDDQRAVMGGDVIEQAGRILEAAADLDDDGCAAHIG